MKYNYSLDFHELIDSPEKMKDALMSSSFSGTFEAWERRKAFIAGAIHKGGIFLDIGCGNGFLLRCLQEWSDHEVIPYGIDINAEFIRKAKQLFPNHQNNFAVLAVAAIANISKLLPDTYDFVFFSSDWSSKLPDEKDSERINELLRYVNPGGRLIIGFYGQGENNNLEALSELQTHGVEFSGILENSQDTNILGWVELVN